MTRNPLALAALACAAVPGLAPTRVGGPEHPGTDVDVAVVLDDRGRRWVVRSPRGAAVAAVLDAELRLLDALRRRLTVAVPEPAGRAPLPEGGHCVVYPMLPGRSVQPGDLTPGPGLAADVGRALAALHDVPPAVVEEAGRPVYTATEYRDRRMSEVDRAAATGAVPPRLLARWERALEDVAPWRFVTTPVHGDLAAEHVLVGPADDAVGGRAVTGIIDWGEACVADPADDLAWLALGSDEAVLDTVLESYSMARSGAPDRHLLTRARLAGELALARWLLAGTAAGDTAVIDRATAALRDLDERTGQSVAVGQ